MEATQSERLRKKLNTNAYGKDPNTKRFKRTLIYLNTETQYDTFVCLDLVLERYHSVSDFCLAAKSVIKKRNNTNAGVKRNMAAPSGKQTNENK